MNATNPALLLCTNGSENTRPALDYGLWLAEHLKWDVVLLGIVEEIEDAPRVRLLVDEAVSRLENAGISYELRIGRGKSPDVVSSQAASGNFLTVIGPLGRPAWQRVLHGRSFRRILQKVSSPVLYVRQPRFHLKRILVCSGGLRYASGVERLSFSLARHFGAEVTLLHVVEPVTLEYPLAKEVHRHWQNILETDTPQGRNLRLALSEAQEAQVPAKLKVRHGNIVHEILEEARTGAYDLLGMGSPYSAHSLRHLYMPNVTAEVAEGILLPVLAVRQEYTMFF